MLTRLMLAVVQAAPQAAKDGTDAAAPAPTSLDKAKQSLSSIDDIRSFDDAVEKGGALIELLEAYAIEFIPKVIVALLWLIVGLILIKLLTILLNRAFKIRNVDESIRGFISSVLRIGLRILLIIMVLGVLGLPTASLGFIIGAASLAIGFALKDTLQNFAGGIVVLLLKPYKIGDFIEAQGFSGTVRQIQIFNTIMTTSDNRRVIIPNGKLSTSALINYSVEDNRRIEMTVGIGYSDDIEHARAVVQKIIDDDPRTVRDPEPIIKVGNLGDSSVDLLLRIWVARGDFWAYRVEFLEKVKHAFDAEGISIPYPQSEVTMRQAAD